MLLNVSIENLHLKAEVSITPPRNERLTLILVCLDISSLLQVKTWSVRMILISGKI